MLSCSNLLFFARFHALFKPVRDRRCFAGTGSVRALNALSALETVWVPAAHRGLDRGPAVGQLCATRSHWAALVLVPQNDAVDQARASPRP